MEKELKELLAELFKHYKESHCTQGGDGDISGDKVVCYGCGVTIHYDEQFREFPPLIHKDECPVTVMGNRIKDFLKKRTQDETGK